MGALSGFGAAGSSAGMTGLAGAGAGAPCFAKGWKAGLNGLSGRGVKSSSSWGAAAGAAAGGSLR